jgi:hypothetical protein
MQGLEGTGGKTAAAGVNCNRLVREGKLIPDSGSTPAFAEYVESHPKKKLPIRNSLQDKQFY